MRAPLTEIETPTAARLTLWLAGLAAILYALLCLILIGCAGQSGPRMRVENGIVLTEDGKPVGDAVVRLQTTAISATSSADGRFALTIPQSSAHLGLTAWAPGFFIGGPLSLEHDDTALEFQLIAHAVSDNPEYRWLSSIDRSGQSDDHGCAECHSAEGSGLGYSLPVDEWQQDAHAASARNQRFLTMYLGTDTLGNQSPATQYVSRKDYGTEPLKPDLTSPYFGPGYKLDFPDSAGNCATCHAPAAAIDAPFDTNPAGLEGVASEGIPCDFCHKIWDVTLDPQSGLPHQNMPGVLSFQFRRPLPGTQFFAGPLDDVAPGEDTYSPLQAESQFCAPCHHGVFWDVVVYDSFGEWLRSEYSDPDGGQSCQDCHMPRLGADHFALPERGGLVRDPATIFSHKMPGASDESLLQNSVTMTVTSAMEAGSVRVQVSLINDQAGHHVPTGSPLRHLILLVSAEDERGKPLPQLGGPRLPDWCGVGDADAGYYAGQAGMAYAKVLAEQWTNYSPTAAYWNATYLVSDNRLSPFIVDTTQYSFESSSQGPVHLQVRLLYRRAFIELAEQKKWLIPDILMEETVLEVVP